MVTVVKPRATGPSPRQRRRLALGIQYTAFVVVVALAVAFANWPAIGEYFLDADAARLTVPKVFTVALRNTLIYTLAAYALGFALGLVVALMRLSSVPPYRWVSLAFIEIFRGLPALLVLVLIAFGLPIAFPGLEPPGGTYGQVALGLGLVGAAYIAETIRAGIEAVPKGQMEAARSLGMSYTRAMVTIVLPQALRIVIPPLMNLFVMLLKDTSLVFVLGVSAGQVELSKFGESIAIQVADVTPMVVAGAAYLVITIPLGYLVRLLETRQARGR